MAPKVNVKKNSGFKRTVGDYSVGIPTIGREETLPAVLLSISFQKKLPKEVVVLDEAKRPVSEHYFVNQALDVLSLKGVDVRIVRNRNREGIGSARIRLAKECTRSWVLMLDDDVVMEPTCIENLISAMERNLQKTAFSWAVPTCLLVPSNFSLDGYTDKPVRFEDPAVQIWLQKYPWFAPYYQYDPPREMFIPASGTQAIFFKRLDLLSKCAGVVELGKLPREDTYITAKLGNGLLASAAICRHFEHPSQAERGNWGDSMFYKLHQACIEDPDNFLNLLKR
jgi:hypothetical protein